MGRVREPSRVASLHESLLLKAIWVAKVIAAKKIMAADERLSLGIIIAIIITHLDVRSGSCPRE